MAVAPAWAQDRPNLMPTRDVDITYHAEESDTWNINQRARWLAASHKLRVDPPGAGVFMIVDYNTHRVAVVRPADRKAVELPAGGALPGVTGSAGSYVRRGAETVAGLPCTDWDTKDNGGSTATVCFTADGVMLRASRNGKVLVEATSVAYRPQDPADFTVPPGFQVLTPPPPTPP